MLNLIIKDLYLQKKMFLFALGYSLFVLVAFQNPVFEAGSYIMGAVAVAYMFILGVCAYEDKNKSEIILISLPLKRRIIVVSKYLSVFIFTMVSLGLIGILGVIMKGSGLPVPIRYIGFRDVVGALASIGFLVSLYFPFYFRFGYIKSRFFNLVLFLMVFFAPTLVVELVKNNYGPEFLAQALAVVNSLSDWQAVLGLVGLVFLMMFVSMVISIALYLKRDF